LGNFCTAKSKQRRAVRNHHVIKAIKETIYGIPQYTRSHIGDASLRADHRWLSMLRSAALASNVLFEMIAF
jgi:hypothetical protein